MSKSGTVKSKFESFATALPGAKQFFDNQKKGAKGIRLAKQTHSKRRTLVPTNIELDDFYKSTLKLDPNIATRRERLKYYESLFINWLWLLQLNYNLLLYGFGAKSKLLRHFAETHLAGEDVLMISGFSAGSKESVSVTAGEKVIKSLLETIAKKVLNISEMSNAHSNLDLYCASLISRLDRHYGRTRRTTTATQSAVSDSEGEHRQAKKPKVTAPNHDLKSEKDFETELESVGEASMSTDLSHVHSLQLESSVYQRKSLRPLVSKSSAALEVDPDWGKRYVHAQAHLYIVVDSIDGPLLRTELAARVLSQLAGCTSVTLVAGADTLNTSLLWSPLQLAHFRWTYVHAPTWETHPRRKGSSAGPLISDDLGAAGTDPEAAEAENEDTGRGSVSKLDPIIKGLTSSNKELLQQIVKLCSPRSEAQSSNDRVGPMGEAVLMATLLDECKKSLILRTVGELEKQLSELADHRLLRVEREKGRRDRDRVVCLVPLALLAAKLTAT